MNSNSLQMNSNSTPIVLRDTELHSAADRSLPGAAIPKPEEVFGGGSEQSEGIS